MVASIGNTNNLCNYFCGLNHLEFRNGSRRIRRESRADEETLHIRFKRPQIESSA